MLSDGAGRELRRASHSLANAQLALRSLRLARIFKRFNPSQARLPAGTTGGGRWTAGGGSGGGGATFHPVSTRPRAGSGATRVIRGRVHEVTPGQEARLDVSAAQARAVIREVQRHDPNWRPRPSIYEGVEGEIAANQSDALQAAARLRELGARELAPKPPETTLIPKGQVIGRRQGRADGDTRTVTSAEFDEMLEAISQGAEISDGLLLPIMDTGIDDLTDLFLEFVKAQATASRSMLSIMITRYRKQKFQGPSKMNEEPRHKYYGHSLSDYILQSCRRTARSMRSACGRSCLAGEKASASKARR